VKRWKNSQRATHEILLLIFESAEHMAFIKRRLFRPERNLALHVHYALSLKLSPAVHSELLLAHRSSGLSPKFAEDSRLDSNPFQQQIKIFGPEIFVLHDASKLLFSRI
jgi:hypothetical protein